MRKQTTEEFIERASLIHNNKYSYEKSSYKNSNSKVIITCNKHGDFEQAPAGHLSGQTCPECARENRSFSNEFFIEKANLIHLNKYIYSPIKYHLGNISVDIVCKTCGHRFTQQAHLHLKGSGCAICAQNVRLTTEGWITRAKAKWGDLYSYDHSVYLKATVYITVTCATCNTTFRQLPNEHLKHRPICECNLQNVSTEDFIKKAQDKLGNLFDYSETSYINFKTPVKIKCIKHNLTFLQSPTKHLELFAGCPSCKKERYSKGELSIKKILSTSKKSFTKEFRIKECKSKNPLPFDFAVFEDEEKTKLKCLIEYDGEQHFKAVTWLKGAEALESTQRRDKIKTDYCIQNSIKLIRIPYWDFENIEEILIKELI